MLWFLELGCRFNNMKKKHVIDLLKGKQINPTVQRIKIARFLLKKPQHLTAKEVFVGLQSKQNNIARATIYNTLGLFVKKGVLRQVVVDTERVLYDSNTNDHHHVYNVDTGELIDIDSSNIILNAPNIFPPNTQLASVDFVVKIQNTIH
jgi:Fur family iron response transcriptional regulator